MDRTAVPPEAPRPPSPASARNAGRRLALVLLLSIVAAVVAYRGPLVSLLTHLKGSPTSTVAYEPYPESARPEARIALVGDAGDSGSRLSATAAAVRRIGGDDPYDALVLLGDNVYPAGNPDRLDETVFAPFVPVLDTGARLLAVLGNHDVMEGRGDVQLQRLGMPARWWSTHLPGDVLVVGLDTTRVDDPAQRRFIEATLAVADERWKVVVLHHPPYSAGYQGSDHEVRDAFVPLFERYDVQLVVSGHDHDYQRSVPMRGVVYVVSGGAAGTRRTGEADFTAVSFSWHHFLDVAVFPERLVGRAVNQDARVADEFVIER